MVDIHTFQFWAAIANKTKFFRTLETLTQKTNITEFFKEAYLVIIISHSFIIFWNTFKLIVFRISLKIRLIHLSRVLLVRATRVFHFFNNSVRNYSLAVSFFDTVMVFVRHIRTSRQVCICYILSLRRTQFFSMYRPFFRSRMQLIFVKIQD